MDNFIVSARKYRPATFVSVIGQEHITSTLRNAILRGQLAHAYLFCGPRGVGKTTCARIFAKAINCLNPADGEACNECESCKSFNEGRSFNIHELDAASNNSVDDIRTLTEQVRIPPQIGRYSVYIIDEVHMLSLQAFNAFLKTLEEPPAHAIFILATTEKHKIIPTILSRCQIYDFNRIKVDDSVKYLKYIAQKEGVTFDEESLHIIAQKSDGGMRDALSMFDKVVSFSGANLSVAQVAATLNVLDYDTYFNVTQHILEADYTSALLLLDEVLRKGFSIQTFVAGLNAHLRDLLMCKNPQTLPLLEVTGSVAERYKGQSAQCPVPLLVEGMNLLTAIDGTLRSSTNQRLSIELGLMKLCGLGQKKNSDTLTVSLPPLIKRVGGGAQAATVVAVEEAVSEERAVKGEVVLEVATEEAVATSEAENTTTNIVNTPNQSIPPAEKVNITQDSIPEKEEAASPQPAVEMSISGRSISSIMSSKVASATQSEPLEETDEEVTEEEIDELTENRIIKGCELFAKEISKSRPRIGIIISEASVAANTITLRVPNESSYDEISKSLTDIQREIVRYSGVKVALKFNLKIEADKKGLKPFKVEDRLKFLTDKNPHFNDLRQALELEAE